MILNLLINSNIQPSVVPKFANFNSQLNIFRQFQKALMWFKTNAIETLFALIKLYLLICIKLFNFDSD